MTEIAGNLATNAVHVDGRWWAWLTWAVAIGLGLLSVVVVPRRESWSSVQTAARDQAEVRRLAQQLAMAVKAQWHHEMENRRIYDPFPMRVRWQLAAEHLTDHWANIRGAGAGGNAEPLALEGQLDQIVSVYRRIPSGRLLVLGAAGSGKTVTAVQLTLGLLSFDSRSPDDPVPVVFDLWSWDATGRSFRDWLADQLVRGHPGLGATDAAGETAAVALINAGRVLPVLDGFDELAAGCHVAALTALNATTTPLVLTSRPEEYSTAVGGADVLTAAAGIHVTELSRADLLDYLPRTARKRPGRDGYTTAWNPVFAELERSPARGNVVQLMAVLSSPLMLSLARTIYSDRDGANPVELLDAQRFPDRSALADHLLAAFVPAAFERPIDIRPAVRQRWTPDHARRWLGGLADAHRRQGTLDITWWDLPDIVPERARRVVAGLALGLLWAAAAAVAGPPALHTRAALSWMPIRAAQSLAHWYPLAPILALAAGFVWGFAELETQAPARLALRFTGHLNLRRRALESVLPALPLGLIAGYLNGPAAGLGVGCVSALAWTLIDGLAAPVELDREVSPRRLLVIDRATAICKAAIAGLSWSIALMFVTNRAFALVVGLAFGLSAALFHSAWAYWAVVGRPLLPLTGRVPWPVLTFLRDCHRRGVLRQAGPTYQFRHARLQEHLASWYRLEVLGVEATAPDPSAAEATRRPRTPSRWAALDAASVATPEVRAALVQAAADLRQAKREGTRPAPLPRVLDGFGDIAAVLERAVPEDLPHDLRRAAQGILPIGPVRTLVATRRHALARRLTLRPRQIRDVLALTDHIIAAYLLVRVGDVYAARVRLLTHDLRQAEGMARCLAGVAGRLTGAASNDSTTDAEALRQLRAFAIALANLLHRYRALGWMQRHEGAMDVVLLLLDQLRDLRDRVQPLDAARQTYVGWPRPVR
jgi:hypothetical protein